MKTKAKVKKAKDASYRAALIKSGITPPTARPITDARWVAAQDDWYVYIDDRRWYWWDRRESVWKAMATGPR